MFLHSVFMEQKNAFKSVVLIQYPSKGIYVLGFITSIAPELISDIVGEPMKNIFVPTTPNPTTGMLVMIPEKNIICLRMPVDAAVKIVVSGGILVPEMNEN